MTDMSAFPLSGFGALIGEEIVSVSPDEVVLRLAINDDHKQPFGLVHGGVWCSLVETAASIAGAVWLGRDGNVVGVNNNTDFLRSMKEGTATATATPVHRGRTQQIWLVEITNEESKLVARGQVRLQNMSLSSRTS